MAELDISNRHNGWVVFWATLCGVSVAFGIFLIGVASKPQFHWVWLLVTLLIAVVAGSIYGMVAVLREWWPMKRSQPRSNDLRWTIYGELVQLGD